MFLSIVAKKRAKRERAREKKRVGLKRGRKGRVPRLSPPSFFFFFFFARPLFSLVPTTDTLETVKLILTNCHNTANDINLMTIQLVAISITTFFLDASDSKRSVRKFSTNTILLCSFCFIPISCWRNLSSGHCKTCFSLNALQRWAGPGAK